MRRKPTRQTLPGMDTRQVTLSRRGALRLGLAGLGAALAAPSAFAAPSVSFPLRIAYTRVSPQGFVHIRYDEQAVWMHMARRMGGLLDTLAPMQPHRCQSDRVTVSTKEHPRRDAVTVLVTALSRCSSRRCHSARHGA